MSQLLKAVSTGAVQTKHAILRTTEYLGRMKPHQWAWLHFKIVLGLGWSTGILFVTPVSIMSTTTEANVKIWTYGTIIGALISVFGLLLSVSKNRYKQEKGLRIELVGVVLFGGGPLQYFILQLTFVGNDFVARYALTWFAYAMLSVVITRFIILLTLMRKGSTDRSGDNE